MRPWLLLLLLLVACRPVPTAPPAPSPTPTEPPFYAPDFTATALDGTVYTLSHLRGRWVILNFWATWCAPCLTEMPALQAIAAKHADEITLLGINMRESPQTVAAFVAEHKLGFPILVEPDPETLTSYQVIGLPQTVVIDPRGEIVYRQFGPLSLTEFEALLADLMAETGPSGN